MVVGRGSVRSGGWFTISECPLLQLRTLNHSPAHRQRPRTVLLTISRRTCPVCSKASDLCGTTSGCRRRWRDFPQPTLRWRCSGKCCHTSSRIHNTLRALLPSERWNRRRRSGRQEGIRVGPGRIESEERLGSRPVRVGGPSGEATTETARGRRPSASSGVRLARHSVWAGIARARQVVVRGDAGVGKTTSSLQTGRHLPEGSVRIPLTASAAGTASMRDPASGGRVGRPRDGTPERLRAASSCEVCGRG